MIVDILHNGKMIGRCGNLDPIDPPMGVAAGRFDPTPDYDPRRHAFSFERDYNVLDDKAALSARSAEFGAIPCVGVVIEDGGKILNERTVTILGIPYPDYETFFASYPAYKAYWRRD